MSVHRSGDEEQTDYASFEYQQILFSHEESGGASARSTFNLGVEPLQTRGGLDVNEVAELVAMRIRVVPQTDDHGSLSVTEEGVIDFRGSIGVNLDSLGDILGVGQTALDRNDTNPLETNDGSDAQLRSYGMDKAEVLYNFHTSAGTPFSSDAGGVGGGGFVGALTDHINFREELGRGPVLDASDEIAVVSRAIKNNVQADFEGDIRLQLVWDTAEVEDAGRRFSVPMDD